MPEDGNQKPFDPSESGENAYVNDGAVHNEGVQPVSGDDTVTPSESFEPVASSPDVEPATSPQAAAAEATPAQTPAEQSATPAASLTEPAMAPFSTEAAVPAAAAAPMAPLPKKSKKKFIIGGVIAAVLVLLGGGGALAYTMYQQPDKVVADGLVNVIKAKMTGATGTATIASEDVALTVDVTGKSSDNASALTADVKVKLKSGTLSGNEFDVTADSVFVKDGTLYFRLSNLDKVFDAYLDAMFSSDTYGSSADQYKAYAKSMYSPILAKINNQWIKVSADDLKDIDKDSSDDMKCLTDAFNKLRDDKNVSKEVADTYKANKFITIKEKLGTKDGSMGYLLDFDKDKAKQFGDALENTDFGKSVKDCTKDSSSSSSSSAADETNIKNGRFEVWVSQWTHQITQVKASGEDADNAKNTFSFDLKPTYNKLETVDTPKDAKSIKELQSEIESLILSSASSSSSSFEI